MSSARIKYERTTFTVEGLQLNFYEQNPRLHAHVYAIFIGNSTVF